MEAPKGKKGRGSPGIKEMARGTREEVSVQPDLKPLPYQSWKTNCPSPVEERELQFASQTGSSLYKINFPFENY